MKFDHIWEKKSYISLNYLIYKSRTLTFAFRKLELDMIYNVYSNELPFKYYVIILGNVQVLYKQVFPNSVSTP